ncbi:MAG: CopG family transcriptional regulator [Tunicatimonas sp.]
MRAKEFDDKFDDGKVDIVSELDFSTATRPNQRSRRININFPSWMVTSLDREARRLGVTRQAVIKVWLAERLEEVK